MGVTEFLSGKKLIVILIGMGILIVTTVSYMDWYDENVLNPRIVFSFFNLIFPSFNTEGFDKFLNINTLGDLEDAKKNLDKI